MSPKAARISAAGWPHVRFLRRASTASPVADWSLAIAVSTTARRASRKAARKSASLSHIRSVRSLTPTTFAASSMVGAVRSAAIAGSVNRSRLSPWPWLIPYSPAHAFASAPAVVRALASAPDDHKVV